MCAPISKIKDNKAVGSSGLAADIIKAVTHCTSASQCMREAEVQWVTDICYAAINEGRVPEDWSKSYMINV